jgi:hypothetical protein
LIETLMVITYKKTGTIVHTPFRWENQEANTCSWTTKGKKIIFSYLKKRETECGIWDIVKIRANSNF